MKLNKIIGKNNSEGGASKMNNKELNFILQEGEGLKIEFKESLKNIDKELVAFTNAEGGRIFVGVIDDNKIKGAEITNKLKSELQDIARNCDPPIGIELESFNNILIVYVKEGTNKFEGLLTPKETKEKE